MGNRTGEVSSDSPNDTLNLTEFNMPDHTPGPWNCSERGHNIDAIVNSNGSPVCYLYLDQILPEDLSLILAAPDLLAACQAYIDCVTFEETENADNLIKSSVAKALGKSQ